MKNSLFSVFSYIHLALMGCVVGSINGSNATKIVLKLKHRDSIFPTSSNDHSIKSYLQSESDDIRAPLIPEEYRRLFWVNISIGEPPIPQLLAMDTGSPLTWFGRNNPIYDPKTSSTCNILSCSLTQQCLSYFPSHCGKNSQCIYNIAYAGNTKSRGILGFERFTFTTSSGGVATLPNILLGIETNSHGTSPWLNGILALQVGNNSLLSHVGNKFSYCVSDPHYPFNHLILGDGAILEGDTTPMSINGEGKYVITLVGIRIGDKELDINKEEFEYNVLIDSGTTCITLPRREFDQIKNQVVQLVDGILQPVYFDDPDILCYYGNLERDLKGFPTVILHLAEETDLTLDAERLFKRHDDNMFCMALQVSKTKVHIIGIIAQQYFNIGFDLNAKMASFQTIACDLLGD